MPVADLHHTIVKARGASPDRYMLVLHGILGSGGNFRTVAKHLADACPTWGMVLVDLRGHGQSSAPAQSTLADAANDLRALEARLDRPVHGALGHSFGGKVALAYAAAREQAGEPPLDQLWVLDASPSARPGVEREDDPLGIVRMLEALPQPFESRDRFIEAVMAAGHVRAVADWLAMNVRRDDDGLRLRLDLGVIRSLLASYFESDLWKVLEEGRAARSLHVVVGGLSRALDTSDRERLAQLAARTPRVLVHTLERAGHWVHVDDPRGLHDVLKRALCDAPG